VSSDEQAFQEFESLFVEKILNASINNDDPEEENFFESNETQLYREILHREVAKEFSKQHSIGTFKNSMELPKGYRRA
jgi:Rod binding domain-containing protein